MPISGGTTSERTVLKFGIGDRKSRSYRDDTHFVGASMYCPICKAEYRDGFQTCSDCLTTLTSLDEANAARTALLWKGTSTSRFDQIVGALQDAKIPHNARSSATAEGPQSFWAHMPIIGRYVRTYEQMTWQVNVLDSDHAKARAVIEKIN